MNSSTTCSIILSSTLIFFTLASAFQIDVFADPESLPTHQRVSEHLLQNHGSALSSDALLNWHPIDSWNHLASLESQLRDSDFVINALKMPWKVSLSTALASFERKVPTISVFDCSNEPSRLDHSVWCLEPDYHDSAAIFAKILDQIPGKPHFAILSDDSLRSRKERNAFFERALGNQDLWERINFDFFLRGEMSDEESLDTQFSDLIIQTRMTVTDVFVFCVEPKVFNVVIDGLGIDHFNDFISIACDHMFKDSHDIEGVENTNVTVGHPAGFSVLRPIFISRALERSYTYEEQSIFEAIELVSDLRLRAQQQQQFSVTEFISREMATGSFLSSSGSLSIRTGKRAAAFTVLNADAKGDLIPKGDFVAGVGNVDFGSMFWATENGEMPDGSAFTYYTPHVYANRWEDHSRAFEYCLDQINEGKAFPELNLQYKIKANVIVTGFEPSAYENAVVAMRDVPDSELNSVFTGGLTSSSTEHFINYFRSLPEDRLHPVILTGISNAPRLNLRKDYPNLVRASSNSGQQTGALAYLIRSMDWKKICVIHSTGTFANSFYEKFLEELEAASIETINHEQKREWPLDASYDFESPEVLNVMEELREQRCRIFVTITDGDIAYILSRYYDLGLWGEGFIQFLLEWIDFFEEDTDDERLLEKVRAVIDGGIGILQTGYAGEIGGKVKRQLEVILERNDLTQWDLYGYDTAALLSAGIANAISSGRDHEDPATMNEVLRDTSITGISGEIRFSKDENSRRGVHFHITNYVEGQFHFVGEYDPYGDVILLLTADPVWPGEDRERPIAYRPEDHDCPYYESEAKDNYYEREPLFVCIGILIVLIIPVLVLAWKKWIKGRSFQPITNLSILMTFSDFFIMAHLVIEAIQLIAIGPDFDHYAQLYTSIPRVLNLRLELILDLGEDYFNYLILISFGIVALYFLAAFIKFLDLDYWKSRCVPEPVMNLLIAYVGIVVMVGYMPIISAFMDVFSCDYSVEVNGETKYYLSRDCRRECGDEEHLFLAKFAAIGLLLFVPLATFQRIRLQIAPSEAHIVQHPFFLFAKSILIFVFIVLGKLFAFDSASLSMIMFGFMNVFAFVFHRRQVINIAGIEVLQKGLLWVVLCEYWTTMFSFFLTQIHSVVFFIALTIAWVSIVVSSFYRCSKLPKILYTGHYRSTPIRQLFAAMFSSQRLTTEVITNAKDELRYKDIIFFHQMEKKPRGNDFKKLGRQGSESEKYLYKGSSKKKISQKSFL